MSDTRFIIIGTPGDCPLKRDGKCTSKRVKCPKTPPYPAKCPLLTVEQVKELEFKL